MYSYRLARDAIELNQGARLGLRLIPRVFFGLVFPRPGGDREFVIEALVSCPTCR